MQLHIFIIVCLSTSQTREKEKQKLGQKVGAQERVKQKATGQNHFLFPSHVVQLHKPKQGVYRMKDQLDSKYALHIHRKQNKKKKKKTRNHLICVLKLYQL